MVLILLMVFGFLLIKDWLFLILSREKTPKDMKKHKMIVLIKLKQNLRDIDNSLIKENFVLRLM